MQGWGRFSMTCTETWSAKYTGETPTSYRRNLA